MFGNNPIRPIEWDSLSQLLWVQEVFATIQGEGPDAGTPALFIRLAGCNLACHFCDTDFESSTWHPHLTELTSMIEGLKKQFPAIQLAVLTGGEPLRQNILSLVYCLNYLQFRVQIETAGTYFPDQIEMEQLFDPKNLWKNSIVCSPKTAALHPNILPLITAYKYIITKGETDEADGLPCMSTQTKGQSRRLARPQHPPTGPPLPVYIQPCDAYDPEQNTANKQHCAILAKRFGYRLSTQIHKLYSLP